VTKFDAFFVNAKNSKSAFVMQRSVRTALSPTIHPNFRLPQNVTASAFNALF
jgi:hypothetical protein